jgi:hypothetical protein
MNKLPLPDTETLSDEVQAALDRHFKNDDLTKETEADVKAVMMSVLAKYEIPPNLKLAKWFNDWLEERGPLQ